MTCKVTMLKVASGKDRGRLVRDQVCMAFSGSWEHVVGQRKGAICVSISADAHHSCLGIVPSIPSTPRVIRAAKSSWQALPPVRPDGMPLPAGSHKHGFISQGDRAGSLLTGSFRRGMSTSGSRL